MNSLKNSLKVVYFAIWPDHIFEYIFALRISMIGLRRYIQNRKDTIQIPLCRSGPGFGMQLHYEAPGDLWVE